MGKIGSTVSAGLLISCLAAFAENPKLARELQQVNGAATVDVIVQYRQAPTAAHHQKVTGRGGSLKTALDAVKGGHYSMPAGKLAELARDPDVVYISPDRAVKGSLDFAASTVGADIALQNAWEGSGIGVAVIDSGISDHWDLREGSDSSNSYKSGKSRIVYSESFLASGRGVKAATDEYGHGTHVAGIIAGNATSSEGRTLTHTFRGMARKANLVNLRVLDKSGAGQDSYVIAAIGRAIALKSTYNIRVINLSLGRPVYESYTNDPLCQAVEAAWKAGIVVVVAAGNDGRDNTGGRGGYATINAPGNDPYVITVGAMKTRKSATRADDEIASYSSKGPTFVDHIVKPDIVAPGNQIISLLMNGNNWIADLYPQNIVPYSYYQTTGSTNPSYTYVWLSGTSMATPMVSGAAVLLVQKDPGLTPDQVKARLMKSASKSFPGSSTAVDPVNGASYTSQYDIFTVGAGYLDVWAALNNTDLLTGRALSPTAEFDASTGKVTLASVDGSSATWGTSASWGTSAVWGYSAVWGSRVIDSTSAIWGSSAVWGSSNLSGFSAVWGSSAVWGFAGSSASSGTYSLTAATSISSPESVRIAIYGEN